MLCKLITVPDSQLSVTLPGLTVGPPLRREHYNLYSDMIQTHGNNTGHNAVKTVANRPSQVKEIITNPYAAASSVQQPS
jgi:hypothetical protein